MIIISIIIADPQVPGNNQTRPSTATHPNPEQPHSQLQNSQGIIPAPQSQQPAAVAAPINNDQQTDHQPADRANRVIYNEIEDYISKFRII